MKLNKNEIDMFTALLDKLLQAAVEKKSTEVAKNELIKLINQELETKYKAAYSKGYKAGTKSVKLDDWQYDPGDSRG